MGGLKEQFLKAPLNVRRAAVVLQGAQNRATRYGAPYREHLQMLAESERWSAGRMRAYQGVELLRLLREAKAGTAYYKESLADLDDAALADVAQNLDLQSLPLLEKSTLKERTPDFYNTLRKTAIVSSTSGTSGKSMVVEYDSESVQRRFAFMHRQRVWAGAEPFARTVQCSGRRLVRSDRERAPFWMSNPFENQFLVSTYHLSRAHLPVIVERIQAFRPEILHGFPSALLPIATYAEERGLRFPTLIAATTTAETLVPDDRLDIESGLGVKVHDFYSASEGVPFILECVAGRRHLCPESGLFEILDEEGRPTADGELGEIVVTSFVQWKTPLIRYRTGDTAVRGTEAKPCACGRTLPYVEQVSGRKEDLIVTRDGRHLGVFNDRVMKGLKGLRESQSRAARPVRVHGEHRAR